MRTIWDSKQDRKASRRRWTWVLSAGFLLGLLSIRSVGAQERQGTAPRVQDAEEATDSRWLPWLGCWHLLEEQLGELDRVEADRSRFSESAADGFTGRALICLTPSEDGSGVDVKTLMGGRAVLEETIRADGLRHPTEESDCRGGQLSEWSRGGRRLFTRSELECEDASHRSVSGVSLMARRSTWVDIQVVETGGHQALAVRRYRPAPDQITAEAGVPLLPPDEARAAYASRLAIAVPLTHSEVIEASEKIDPEVLEAALVETGATFDLDSKTLVELDEAAVPESVIDLMVAVSFPNHFVVERPTPGGGSLGAGAGGYFGSYGYLPYNAWYPYYSVPFGYSYWWAPYHPVYVVWPGDSYLARRDATLDQSTGRVVRSQGYMRVRPRGLSSDTGRTAKRRGSSSPGGSAGNRRPSSGSVSSGGRSSGGRVTTGGYTRGGSSGRGARARGR